MFCTKCGTELPNESKFCPNCGSQKPAAIVCGNCGWKPEEGTAAGKFCPNCGNPL